MSARTVGLIALGFCLAAGCSSAPSNPGGPKPLGGAGGTDGGATGGAGGTATGGSAGAGAGGADSGTGGTGGAGAAAGSGGSAGQDGGAGMGGSGGTGASGGTGGSGLDTCGDGVIQFGEQCDGTNLAGQTCQTLGFDTGSLVCKNCQLDNSGCSGQENCTDGIDNDNDGLVDCADTDCTSICADPCANAVAVTDPGDVSGDTTGHAPAGLPSCARTGSQAAPAVAYKFTAANTGVLDVALSTNAPLVFAVRTSCGDTSSETLCSSAAQGSVAIQQGETVYVVIAGGNTGDTGSYTLSLRSRVPKCGDGVRDSGEECDDGNTASGDGCSSTCTIESDETESNDTTAQANNYVDPFHAQISPSGDVDVVKVTVPSAGSTLNADTYDYGDGACYKKLLDSVIDIIGTDGSTVIASDNDGGSGLCSHAVASGLAAGTYYVRVKAAPFGNTPTFPYVLHVAVQ